MKKKWLIILIICLWNGVNLYSQKQKDWVELGQQAYNIGDYYGARHYYENALEMDSTKAALQFQYAQILRHINDYSGAERQYHKVYRKGRGRYYPKGIYWIALMNEYMGDYNKALKFWKKYRSEDDGEKKLVAQHKKSCEFAIDYQKKISNDEAHYSTPLDSTEVINAGRKINSAESEFGIVSIGDSILYYGSLRGDYTAKDVLLEPEYDIKIYRSRLKRKFNRYTVGKAITDRVNMPEMITANGAFNHDYSLFFFTQCDQDRHCEIMVANYNEGEFSHIRKLEGNTNTPHHSSTQPSLCKIGGKEYLFFSSDRPGGKGKNDIWQCEIDGDKTQNLVNLSSKINSPENEITPYYDTTDGGLYFSSDWHEGFGGYDIFFSEGDISSLDYPVNILPPYNSSTNDMYYIATNNHTGYLTSNRTGSLSERGETCCNDIWIFQSIESVQEDSLLTDIDIKKELENKKTLADKEFEAFKKDSILPTINGVGELSKYLPITLYFDNDHPNPRTTRTTTKLSYSDTYEAYNKVKSDYYEQYAKGDDLGKSALDSFFKNKLEHGNDKLDYMCRLLMRELEKGESIELVIKGYASPLSNSDYNKNLTLRRIRSLVNELSTWNAASLLPYINGLANNGARLTFKEIPYGESKASATVSDNTDDRSTSVYSPGAALERRIEILDIR